ncbi:MAG: HEAT repeat domain-containing protein [Planctomycetaceae bacterium]|nr:HEAT repeat domain-containing protein [Planctomycetaceae bacterium]
MQQQVYNDWTLDLDPDFSCEETEDGFIVFSKPGLEIWAVVYCEQPFDSETAVRSYLAWRKPDESDVSFRPNSEGISGRAFLTSTMEDGRFLAVAASLGRIIELEFRFQDKSAVDTAVTIWHSLQYSPPAWVKQCGHAEPPLSGLREALERGTNIEAAIDDVLDRKQTAAATAVLLESIKSESATVRQASCDAFAILDDATAEVTDALRERLKDDVIQVRAWAAEALLDLGAPPESVVTSLIEGLQKQEAPLPTGEDRIQGVCGYLCVPDRYHAARILSAVGEATLPARNALLEHQLDESGDVRLQVAEALLNLGEPLENVLPPLRDGLHNPDLSHRERMRIAQSLLEHGESHNDVLPTVIEVLGKATDDSARVEALDVLGSLGAAAQSAADSIENAIQNHSEQWGIKIPAAQALMRMGVKQQLAYPILFDALDEQLAPYWTSEIIIDLGRCLSPDHSGLERISRELTSQDVEVRCAAAFVLAHYVTDVDHCLSIITEALNDSDDETRWSALMFLDRLGPIANSTTERVMQVAQHDQEETVRLAAIGALGQIGHSKRELIEAFLAELSSDADEETGHSIQNTLKRLREPDQEHS